MCGFWGCRILGYFWGMGGCLVFRVFWERVFRVQGFLGLGFKVLVFFLCPMVSILLFVAFDS